MEAEIEVFKVGTHTDSSGNTVEWTVEDLAMIADKYNNQPKGDEHRAPVTLGHDEYDGKEAMAWVKSLRFDGERLHATIYDITDEFQLLVRAGKYKNVSIALFEDELLRHIAVLGAQAPAVRGLAPISFSSNKSYKEYNIGKAVIKFSYEDSKENKEANNSQFNNNKKEGSMTKDQVLTEMHDYIQTTWGSDQAGDIVAKLTELLDDFNIEQEDKKEEGDEPIPLDELEATAKEPATYSRKRDHKHITEEAEQFSAMNAKIQAMEDDKYFSEVVNNGTLLKKQVPVVKEILAGIRKQSGGSVYQFSHSDGNTTEALLKNFLSTLPKQVEFSDFASTPEGRKEIKNEELIREYARNRKAGK